MIEQKIQRIIDVKDWDLFRGIYNALTFEQLQQINDDVYYKIPVQNQFHFW